MFDKELLKNTPSQTSQYFGKYAGVVVDNAAPPDGKHRGEIKVRVPSILEETPGGGGNQPMEVVASPSFLPGFFFIPELDTQVWVEFVAGDINFPIWTGVWYPVDATPATTADEKPTEKQKVIRTVSGQVIQLDDTDGKEATIIRDAKNDNTITMNSDGLRIDHAKKSTTVMNADGITFTFNDDKSKITMNADGIVIAQGETQITLADDSIEIKVSGGNSIKVDGSSLEIKGPKHSLKFAPSGTTLGEKFIVLDPLITWLTTHMHVGNLGAPTAPPQPPPMLPANVSM